MKLYINKKSVEDITKRDIKCESVQVHYIHKYL